MKIFRTNYLEPQPIQNMDYNSEESTAQKAFDKLYPYMHQIQLNQQAIVDELMQTKLFIETLIKSTPLSS